MFSTTGRCRWPYGVRVTDWDRARDAFEQGMTEVDEHFRAPLFNEAGLILRDCDGLVEREQADDIQRLLESVDPRNSEAYLALAARVHDRFGNSR